MIKDSKEATKSDFSKLTHRFVGEASQSKKNLTKIQLKI